MRGIILIFVYKLFLEKVILDTLIETAIIAFVVNIARSARWSKRVSPFLPSWKIGLFSVIISVPYHEQSRLILNVSKRKDKQIFILTSQYIFDVSELGINSEWDDDGIFDLVGFFFDSQEDDILNCISDETSVFGHEVERVKL